MKFKDRFDRRSFLKLAGAASAGATLPLVSPALGLASLNQRFKVAQETKMMMGTLVSVTVVDPSSSLAQKGVARCFEDMQALAAVFDRHQANGLLAQLNKQGNLSEIPPVMNKVLMLSGAVHQLSNGAFDITVAPVLDAYTRAYKKGGLPTTKEINEALASMGSLRRQGKGLSLTAEGAALTLDGVAKGFIADQGIETLNKVGIKHALINAGGDVAVMGERSPGQPWRVAISDPDQPQKAKMVVNMTKGAIATSGNYEVFFDQERLYHHIINPDTGRSPRTDVSTSVKAGSAAVADAFSTACFVLTPKQAMALIKSRPGLEAMILTRHRQKLITPGFKA